MSTDLSLALGDAGVLALAAAAPRTTSASTPSPAGVQPTRQTRALKPVSPAPGAAPARFPGTAPVTSTELWVGMHLRVNEETLPPARSAADFMGEKSPAALSATAPGALSHTPPKGAAFGGEKWGDQVLGRISSGSLRLAGIPAAGKVGEALDNSWQR